MTYASDDPNYTADNTDSNVPEEPRKSQSRWYAVQVASGCEKRVKLNLEQRAITLGVNQYIFQIEIPQTPAVKLRKDGSRQNIEEKVFPGYVLIRMILDDDVWQVV